MDDQLALPFESLLPLHSEKDSVYPTFFITTPIFVAGDRESTTTDQINGQQYETENGRVTRIGAGLNMYDEDSLIALIQLASHKRLEGPSSSFPIQTTEANTDVNTVVYSGEVTASQINAFLTRGSGGDELQQTRDSLRRLAVQRLIFENDQLGKEGITSLFDYVGDKDFSGSILIQISPAMVKLLQTYQIVDMSIRRQLNDTGKAVHRYLIAQPKEFKIKLADLCNEILYDKGPAELKRALLGRNATKTRPERPNQLQILIDTGFLSNCEITGTGRKVPWVLDGKKSD